MPPAPRNTETHTSLSLVTTVAINVSSADTADSVQILLVTQNIVGSPQTPLEVQRHYCSQAPLHSKCDNKIGSREAAG